LKIYDYDTIFTFGKHKGQKLIDVITSDWEYINWCQENLDHFILAEAMMYVLKEPNGEFQFSKLALEKRKINLTLFRQQKDDQERVKLERYEEIQNEMNQEDVDSYNTFSEESDDFNNSPDFSTDPFNEN
jgi:hypothetical protein